MKPRHWKLLEYLQFLYKDKVITDEEMRKDNIAATMCFLRDLKVVGDYSKEQKEKGTL